MNKILISDLDGTLVQDYSISINNILSIRNLKSMGGLLAISTGRPYNGVEDLIDKYNLDIDFYILLNGALILNKNKNILLHKTVSFNTICNIVDIIKDYNTKISFESGFMSYTLDGVHDNLPYSKKIQINSLDEIQYKNISLTSIFFENMDFNILDNLCEKINTDYGHLCQAFRNTNYIDIVPPGCSKGNGVKLLLNQLEHINSDSLFTIGDSFNDVSMLNITENSFTFHHCEEKLKQIANYKVHSVSECIENFMLKNTTIK